MAARKAPHVVVIGAGSLSQRYHLPSIQHLAQRGLCTFAGLCDLNQEAAAQAAKKFGAAQVYSDYMDMLRTERPDGVFVIVPTKVMQKIAGDVLQTGLPTILEKPPGENVKQCRQLIKAAGRTPHMVAFNRRRCPVLVQGREAIAKRGATKGASARMYRHLRAEDGYVYGTGIHSIDAMRYLGGEIERLETEMQTFKGDKKPSYTLHLGYKNGAHGTLTIRPESGVQLERYDLFGQEAVALIYAGVGWLVDAPGRCELYVENKLVTLPDPIAKFRKLKDPLPDAVGGGFYGEDEAFIQYLHGKAKLTPTLAESLPSVQIAEAAQAGKRWRL